MRYEFPPALKLEQNKTSVKSFMYTTNILLYEHQYGILKLHPFKNAALSKEQYQIGTIRTPLYSRNSTK